MLYRGTVTRATTNGVWATIPALVPGAEFGPMPLASYTVEVDDPVLIADLGGPSRPDLIVVATIKTGVPA